MIPFLIPYESAFSDFVSNLHLPLCFVSLSACTASSTSIPTDQRVPFPIMLLGVFQSGAYTPDLVFWLRITFFGWWPTLQHIQAKFKHTNFVLELLLRIFHVLL